MQDQVSLSYMLSITFCLRLKALRGKETQSALLPTQREQELPETAWWGQRWTLKVPFPKQPKAATAQDQAFLPSPLEGPREVSGHWAQPSPHSLSTWGPTAAVGVYRDRLGKPPTLSAPQSDQHHWQGQVPFLYSRLHRLLTLYSLISETGALDVYILSQLFYAIGCCSSFILPLSYHCNPSLAQTLTFPSTVFVTHLLFLYPLLLSSFSAPSPLSTSISYPQNHFPVPSFPSHFQQTQVLP